MELKLSEVFFGWGSITDTTILVANNYNIGEIEVTGENCERKGPIIAHFATTRPTLVSRDNYYLKGIYHNMALNLYSAVGKTEEQMKTNEFLTLLNANQEDDEIVWKFKPGVNNGYPVLDWQ